MLRIFAAVDVFKDMLRLAAASTVLVALVAAAYFFGTIAYIGIAILYASGFIFTFWAFSRLNGLLSPGLILLRSLLWPIFWTTGWPDGERLPMD